MSQLDQLFFFFASSVATILEVSFTLPSHDDRSLSRSALNSLRRCFVSGLGFVGADGLIGAAGLATAAARNFAL